MDYRMPALIGMFVVTAAAPLIGQTPSSSASTKAAKAWTPPRTADGQPDLQGVWNFSTLTPLERPAEFVGKAFLTDEEAKQFEQRTVQRNDRDIRDKSPEADVSGAYNEFWFNRGVGAARVNGKTRTSLIVDPPDGKIPALTPDGQKRAAARADARREHPADDPEDRSLGERCLLFSAGPPMLSGPYNNYVQLFQTRDHVVIFTEMIHDARIVPLDGRPHVAPGIRALLGDSRGRWDGDTLVVETTNFTDKTNVRGSGERLRLTERFTRADANTLLYEFTVDDPASFTKPWTAVIPMAKTDDLIYEYACHEANYAMSGILRGARSGEKKP